MYSTFEKLLSIFANFVSVIGFVLSLLNVLGLNLAMAKPAQNQRMAVAMVVIFSFASSFATAIFLLKTRASRKNTAVPWFFSVALYALTFWYLLEIGVVLNPDGNTPNPVLGISGKAMALWIFAYVINMAITFKVYIWRIAYPNGYSIEEQFSLSSDAAANGMAALGAMISHIVMLSIFMVILAP